MRRQMMRCHTISGLVITVPDAKMIIVTLFR